MHTVDSPDPLAVLPSNPPRSAIRAALALACTALVAPAADAQTLFSSDTEPGFGSFPGGPVSVTEIDADGDGRLDFVFQTFSGPTSPGTFALELARGAGFYERLEGGLPAGLSTDDVAVLRRADLDGDGDQDLVISESDVVLGSGRPVVRVLHNDGQGVFSVVQTLGPLSSSLFSVGPMLLDDVDGDGALDLVWMPLGTDLAFHRGLPGGLFESPGVALTQEALASGLGALDVNGDGRLDLFVASTQGSVLLEQGTGVFPDFTPAAVALPEARSVLLADVDADGDSDLVLGLNATGAAVLFDEGAGLGSLTELDESFGLDGSFSKFAAGDVDGDGVLDLVGEGSSIVSVWRGTGGGGFGQEEPGFERFALEGSASDVELLDVDGDGDIDFVSGNRRLSIHDGAGGYEALAGTVPMRLVGSDAIADLDGDGWPDRLQLASIGQGFDPLVWLGDGFGRFPTPVPGLFVPGDAVDHALGDLDGDGDVDVYVGRGLEPAAGFGRSQAILINAGDGRLRSVAGLSSGVVDSTRAVAVFDADLDGDLDAVVGNRNQNVTSNANRLEENVGGAKFRDATDQLPPFKGDSAAVAVLDIDADGDPDLVLAQTASPNHSGQDLVFANDGTGQFTDVTGVALSASEEETVDVLVADLNGDGLEDLYQLNLRPGGSLAGTGPSEDRVLLNDASQPGRFLASGAPVTGPVGLNLAGVLLDADGDGDLDLARIDLRTSLFGQDSIGIELDLNDGAGAFTEAGADQVGPGGDLADAPGSDRTVLGAADVDLDGDAELLTDRVLLRGLQRELELRTTVELGQEALFRVRSSAGPSGYLLAYSTAEAALPLAGFGLLRLDLGTASSVVASGTLGADGAALVAVVAPATPSLGGLELFWQALVLGPDGLTRAVRSVF